MIRIINATHTPGETVSRLARRLAPRAWDAWLRRLTARRAGRARPIIEALITRAESRGSFDRVEIETANRCNNPCAFCPVNRDVDPRPAMRMSEEIFDRIIGMLAARRFSGGFALFSNNEPLLDPRLEDLAARARRALPDAYHYLYTNGTLLTVERFEKLMPSLNHLTINNYGGSRALIPPVRKVYEFAVANMPEANIDIHLRRLDERLTTRAGTAPNRGPVEPLTVACFLPFSQLIVRPDGKISQCCDDAVGRATLGDLSSQTLEEAWNSPERRALQAMIRSGRAGDVICRGCDTIDLDDEPLR